MSSGSQLGRDRPLVLVVMDGIGVGRGDAFDAVALANTPNLDHLASGSCRTLKAHGTAVGLPSDADMGNSEVGHNILGAGRIFDQGKRIDNAIASGSIWKSDAWQEIVDRCAGRGGTLHLIGLLSDGNVHSNISHLFEILRQAAEDQISKIRVHALLDGRDVPDPSAERYIALTEHEFAKHPPRRHPVRVRRGPHGHDHGPLRSRLARCRGGLAPHVLGTAHPVPDVLSGVEWGRSTGVRSDQLLPAFTVVTHCSNRSARSSTAMPWSCSTSGVTAPSSCRKRSRQDQISTSSTAGAFPTSTSPGWRCTTETRTPLGRIWSVPSRSTRRSARSSPRPNCPVGGRRDTGKFGHITYFWNGNRSNKFDPQLETYVEIL